MSGEAGHTCEICELAAELAEERTLTQSLTTALKDAERERERLVRIVHAALDDLGVAYPVADECEWRQTHGDAVTELVLALQEPAQQGAETAASSRTQKET